MTTKQDLVLAKKTFDHAWAEAEKYGEEAQKALDMHDEVMGRDTGEMYLAKARRAMQAHDNWMRSAQGASKVMNEYYGQFSPK